MTYRNFMCAETLHAIDEDGTPLLADLLRPFFETLRPAFEARADTIKIGATLSEALALKAEYEKSGSIYPLSPEHDFHPFITSSRVKILTKMSIALHEGKQSGALLVSFRGRTITLAVEIVLHDNRETVILRPQWD